MNSKHGIFQLIIFVLLCISKLFKNCIFPSFLFLLLLSLIKNVTWQKSPEVLLENYKAKVKIFSGAYIFNLSQLFHSFSLQRFFWQIQYSLKILPHLIYRHKHTHITPFEVAKCLWPILTNQDAKLFLGREGRNEFHPLK